MDRERADQEDLTDLLRGRAETSETWDVMLFADRGLSYDKLFHVLDGIRLSSKKSAPEEKTGALR